MPTEIDKDCLPPDGSIDAGLLLLSLATERGQIRTQAEIAQACGCSRALIYLIEKQAIEKLRQRVGGIQEAGELLRDLPEERRYATRVSSQSRYKLERSRRTTPGRTTGKAMKTIYGP